MLSDVRKTEIQFVFGFLTTEPSKTVTSVQTIFPQKLHAVRHSMKKVNKSNFARTKCADNERFKTRPKQSLAYRF